MQPPKRTVVNLASSHSGACIRAPGRPQPQGGVTWTRAACATPSWSRDDSGHHGGARLGA